MSCDRSAIRYVVLGIAVHLNTNTKRNMPKTLHNIDFFTLWSLVVLLIPTTLTTLTCEYLNKIIF